MLSKSWWRIPYPTNNGCAPEICFWKATTGMGDSKILHIKLHRQTKKWEKGPFSNIKPRIWQEKLPRQPVRVFWTDSKPLKRLEIYTTTRCVLFKYRKNSKKKALNSHRRGGVNWSSLSRRSFFQHKNENLTRKVTPPAGAIFLKPIQNHLKGLKFTPPRGVFCLNIEK